MSFNNSITSSSDRRSGSCRKHSSIPTRVQSRCVRSFRISCFNWCCNAFSSLMAFRSSFSLFSSSRLSFSSFEVSGKGSVPLSRYQYINPVWFSNALTHPHDKSGSFQFIQRTLDRHGTAAYRSLWYARFGQGSSISLPKVMTLHRRGSISHTGWSFNWNNPSMNYLYHRTFCALCRMSTK